MFDYLTLTEVVEMQRVLVDRYGGTHGVRDLGAIESSLYRAKSGHYSDLVSRAAALMESLVIHKPFKDANKRTAFAAVDAFLHINGYSIHQHPEKIYQFFINLIKTQQFEISAIEQGLRQVVIKQ